MLGDTITFKIYDSTTDAVINTDTSLDFVVNKHIGTLFQSLSIADPLLNYEADS